MTSFNDFSAIYKKEKSPGKFMRYRFLVARANYNAVEKRSDAFNSSFGFAIGKERRKVLTEKLSFLHGLEPSILFELSVTRNSYNTVVQPILGYVLGIQYQLASNFFLALETIPSLRGSFSIDKENGINKSFAINANLSSNTVAMSLVYRFNKKR